MDTISWLVAGLAAFDGGILIVLWFYLRPRPPFDYQTLYVIGAGMTGFVFHAFMFFSGAFLILQLATILGILGMCRWVPGDGRDA